MNILLSAWLARIMHGGVEKRLHDLGVNLVEHGYPTHMLCAKPFFGPDYPLCKPYQELNATIPISPYTLNAKFKKQIEYLALWTSVYAIKNARANFEICHGRGISCWPAIRSGIPTIVDMPGLAKGTNLRSGLMGSIMDECVNKAAHFIAVSDLARKQLIGDGIAKEKISVVYSSVPIAKIKAGCASVAMNTFNLQPSKKVMLSVQNLNKKKRTFALIEMFRHANKNNDWQLVIVGDGPKRAELARHIEKIGAQDVFLLGYQSEFLFDLYALADAFSLCSYREGAPIVYFEALAAGLPIVATSSGATCEYLKHGKNALVSEEWDDAAFLNNLKLVMSDPKLANDLSMGAAQSAKKYDSKIFLDKCVALYHKFS